MSSTSRRSRSRSPTRPPQPRYPSLIGKPKSTNNFLTNTKETNAKELQKYHNAFLRSTEPFLGKYGVHREGNKEANVPNHLLPNPYFTMSPFLNIKRQNANTNSEYSGATIYARYGTELEREWLNKIDKELRVHGIHVNEKELEEMKESFMNKRVEEIKKENERQLRTLRYRPPVSLEQPKSTATPKSTAQSEPINNCPQGSWCGSGFGGKKPRLTRRRKRSQSKLNYSKRRHIVLNNKR